MEGVRGRLVLTKVRGEVRGEKKHKVYLHSEPCSLQPLAQYRPCELAAEERRRRQAERRRALFASSTYIVVLCFDDAICFSLGICFSLAICFALREVLCSASRDVRSDVHFFVALRAAVVSGVVPRWSWLIHLFSLPFLSPTKTSHGKHKRARRSEQEPSRTRSCVQIVVVYKKLALASPALNFSRRFAPHFASRAKNSPPICTNKST